jgi:choline-sulfatase
MTKKNDVVFIILDSARKDRVSAFGHHRETTPVFDELAEEATMYENAFTPAPWTLPSHCSMFTGRYPSEHGITNGFTDRNLQIPHKLPTIPKVLADQGYATAGFSNNPWVGKLSGLNRGFDRYVEWDLEISRSQQSTDHRLRDSAYSKLHSVVGRAAGQPHALLKRRFFTTNLVDRAKQWMVETENQPSFTFMNIMEAHSPYYPKRQAFHDLDLDPPGTIETRTLNARLLAYVMGKTDLSPEQRKRVMEFYDASLRYQDDKLDELLSLLHARGLFDDTLIVICADHGKTLGDLDRNATPPHYIRDINVNVPLLIKWPNQSQGDRVDTPVNLVDLFSAIKNPEDAGELTGSEDGVLVEDFIPHTGRNTADVVRWRVLASRSDKYVRNDAGEEFLLDRGENEIVVDASSEELSPYRDRLQNRVNRLESSSNPTEEKADETLGKGLEGQLRDLGYLN